jgi:hypothetical protein
MCEKDNFKEVMVDMCKMKKVILGFSFLFRLATILKETIVFFE